MSLCLIFVNGRYHLLLFVDGGGGIVLCCVLYVPKFQIQLGVIIIICANALYVIGFTCRCAAPLPEYGLWYTE